jgi:L-lactate dehydrogenase complex protein LldG
LADRSPSRRRQRLPKWDTTKSNSCVKPAPTISSLPTCPASCDNQPSSRELPAIPKFHSEQPVDLKKQFTAALKELYGEVLTEPPADFEEFLRKRFPDAKTICSAVPEYAGNRVPQDFTRWSDASIIDVTIVRSPLGVAETGSVLLSEEEFRVNTIGFLAHDIVILLDPAEIVENIHDAYGHPHFLDKAYSLLMSGPSGSADIGGITVHPAQGVMTLTVIFWPRAQQPASPKAGY